MEATRPHSATTEDSRLPATRGGGWRWDRIFLLLALPLGLLAVAFIPPMQELDGTAHLLRVDQIARGHLVAPLNAEDRAVTNPDRCLEGFIAGHTKRGLRAGPMSPRGNLRAQPCVDSVPTDISNTALNTPVAYLPQVTGYGLGRLVGGVTGGYYGARLVGLLVYIGLCWLAVRLATRGRAVLFVVALMPSALVLASVLSADGFTLGLALLCIALVLRLRAPTTEELRSTRPRDLVLLAVGIGLLAVSKNLYGTFALLLLLLPADVFRSTKRRVAYVGGLFGGCLVAAGAWSALVVSRVRILIPGLQIDSTAARTWAGENPVSFAASLLRGLWDPWVPQHTLSGYVEVLGKYRPAFAHELFPLGDRAPLWLFGCAVALVVVALVHDGRTASSVAGEVVGEGSSEDGSQDGRSGPGLRAVLAVTVLVVLASTTLIFVGIRLTSVAFDANTTKWVQGRYFLPLTPLLALPVTAAWVGRRGAPRWTWVIPLASTALLVWVVVRAIVLFY